MDQIFFLIFNLVRNKKVRHRAAKRTTVENLTKVLNTVTATRRRERRKTKKKTKIGIETKRWRRKGRK